MAVALGSLAAGPAAGPPRWISRLQRILAAGACLCVIVVVVVAAGNLHLPARAARVGLHDLTLPVNILPALALAAVALEGRRRRGGPLIAREWVLVALFLAVLAYLLTLAPTIKIAEHPWGTAPFRWVYFHIPGAAAFRAPGRWSLAFALPLGLLVAFGANALGNRFSRRRGVMLGALLAAMVVELNVCPLPWTRLPPVPLVYAWLGAQPGDFAVLELPMAEGAVDDWAMFWAANTSWKLLVNGGGGFLARHSHGDRRGDSAGPDPPGLAHAPADRPAALHRGASGPVSARRAAFERCADSAGIRLVGQQGPDDVYELTVAPETGIDLRRYFSSTFARAHPTGVFALRFTGDDPDVTQFVEVSLNGRPLPGIGAAGAAHAHLAAALSGGGPERAAVPPSLPGEAGRDRRGRGYRIGTTGVRSPVDVEIISEGRDQAGRGGLVSAHVNGHEVVDLPRRGYNVVALDGGDGRVLWGDNFDTFRSESESRRMAERIDALPAGTIVIAGVKTDGGGRLTAEGVAALRSVGGQRDLRGTLWVSHALIGVKGAPRRFRRGDRGRRPRDGQRRASAAARRHAGDLHPALRRGAFAFRREPFEALDINEISIGAHGPRSIMLARLAASPARPGQDPPPGAAPNVGRSDRWPPLRGTTDSPVPVFLDRPAGHPSTLDARPPGLDVQVMRARPRARGEPAPVRGQAAGLMFWFIRNRFVGSYFALSFASRS